MRANRFLWWISLSYLLGLVCLAWVFRHALNADAVAYLRLASYYAQGKWGLAVSGYWGPLASWLMAPLLKAGLPPLVVARGFMIFSALVFWGGCLAVFQAFRLPRKWVRTGAALAAAAGLYWSVQFITPDLLLSGLIGMAFSQTCRAPGFGSRGASAFAGILWGLAYLAKAVALPLAVLTIASLAWQAPKDRAQRRGAVWGNLGVLALCFGLLAGPWVLTLSLKYRKLTFSTTPAISHTLTGPPDAPRYHPFARTLGPPEPGRITSWEEPSQMAYNYWSPLESRAYAWHQLKVLLRNSSTCIALLTSLNFSWLLLLVAWPLERLRRGAWSPTCGAAGRALLVPALLLLLYLPCYVTITEQRFFYPAFPFLFAALALWALAPAEGAAARLETAEPRRERAGWWLTVAGGVAPLLAAAFVIGSRPMLAGNYAADLAHRIQQARLAGPVAGSAMLPGGRTGLYLAFLLDQPWYGDKPGATASEFYTSGARLVVARRGSVLDDALAQAPEFADLDGRLFSGAAAAERFPVRVYGRLR